MEVYQVTFVYYYTVPYSFFCNILIPHSFQHGSQIANNSKKCTSLVDFTITNWATQKIAQLRPRILEYIFKEGLDCMFLVSLE